MSKRLQTIAKRELNEESIRITRESKELPSRKEQISKASTDSEKKFRSVEKLTSVDETDCINIAPEISTSSKAETSEIPKTTSKTSTSDKSTSGFEAKCLMSLIGVHTGIHLTTSEESTSNKSPAVEEIPKITSEIPSTPDKPDAPKVLEQPEVRAMSKASTPDERPVFEAKGMSEMSTSDKPDTPKVLEQPEIHPLSKTTSKTSTSDEPPAVEAKKMCLTRETTSEISTSKLETKKLPEHSMTFAKPLAADIILGNTLHISTLDKIESQKVPEHLFSKVITSEMSSTTELETPKIPKAAEVCQMPKTMSETSFFNKTEVPQIPGVLEDLAHPASFSNPKSQTIPDKTEFPRIRYVFGRSDSFPNRESQTTPGKTEEPEISEEHQTRSVGFQISTPVESDNREAAVASETLACSTTSEMFIAGKSEDKTGSMKNLYDDSKVLSEKLKKCSLKENTKSTDAAEESDEIKFKCFERPKKIYSLTSWPNFEEPPLVLATHHLVPSLPLEIFEIFAEIIELCMDKPVILVHESCSKRGRPVASQIVDIAILPPDETWIDGELLPASFIFEHPLNKDNSTNVYADVFITKDHVLQFKDILDLRGRNCAFQDKRGRFTSAGTLFDHLRLKGENLLFFGNTHETRSQIDVLKMIISNQIDVGVLESPVIKCQMNRLPNMDSLHILTSIGPLPPYRIMIKKSLVRSMSEKLSIYMQHIHKYSVWLEKLKPFGITGFGPNSNDNYTVDVKIIEQMFGNLPYY